MDSETAQVISRLGIDPATVPPGQVRLLDFREIYGLPSDKAKAWARNPDNVPAIGYAVDDEHKSPVGLVVRNLQSGPARSHITVANGPGPFWHNFHCALPHIYETGIAVLVEGPKDARVLWSNGIPAAAYLGISPGGEYLKVIKRYADVVFWIPDVDPETRELAQRKREVHQQAEKLGLLLVEHKIPEKDPAELVRTPQWFDRIRERVEELRSLI